MRKRKTPSRVSRRRPPTPSGNAADVQSNAPAQASAGRAVARGCARNVPVSAAVTRSGERPAPPRQKGASTAQRSPNSRPGNTANLRHGAYRARQARDRFRRAAVKDWTAILAERGLGSDRLARAVAREAAFLLGVRMRVEAFLANRGYFKRDGELKSAAGKAIELSGGLLDRCGRLLEKLAESGPVQNGDVIYRCVVPRREQYGPTHPGELRDEDGTILEEIIPGGSPDLDQPGQEQRSSRPDTSPLTTPAKAAANPVRAPRPSTAMATHTPTPAALPPNIPSTTETTSPYPPTEARTADGHVLPAARRNSWMH